MASTSVRARTASELVEFVNSPDLHEQMIRATTVVARYATDGLHPSLEIAFEDPPLPIFGVVWVRKSGTETFESVGEIQETLGTHRRHSFPLITFPEINNATHIDVRIVSRTEWSAERATDVRQFRVFGGMIARFRVPWRAE